MKGASTGRPDALALVDEQVNINRAMIRLLDRIGSLDTDEACQRNSIADIASLLTYELGFAPRTARAWVRISRAWEALPLTVQAFRIGAISFDQLEILAKWATPETEEDLLDRSRYLTTAELAREAHDLVKSAAEETEPEKEPVHRSLRMWWSDDDSHLNLKGEIPGADGVLVETALMALGTKQPQDPVSDLYRPANEQNADALVQMASESHIEDRSHDVATLVVHVKAEDLVAEKGEAIAQAERLLGADEVRRLACDPRIQPAIDDSAGVTVGVGRTTRKIPHWLRRLVTGRDKGCRFPGCHRTRWTHNHHLQHWADGGPTNLDNLVTLCGFHHRLIHREGWQIHGNPNHELSFITGWGSLHEPTRPRFPAHHEKTLLDGIANYQRVTLAEVASAAPT